MQHRHQLLRILADGQFHSGEDIGAILGISRSAVWKSLKAFDELGLDIQAVPRRGYRLAEPLELLDKKRILSAMNTASRQLLSDLEIHEEIDSTNRLVMQKAAAGSKSGLVCLAEWQRSGRGRRGRPWISPYGGNIYLSFLWRFTEGVPDVLSMLSLVAGVAVARTAEQFGVPDVGLKWPNDILVNRRKLGGILLEFAGEGSGPCHIVSGIGVNFRMNQGIGKDIDQPWSDICSYTPTVSRNEFAGALLENLLSAYSDYQIGGFAPFLSDWNRLDICRGQKIVLQLQDGHITGEAQGIDDQGALLIRTDNGIERYCYGEVSLRMMNSTE